MSALLEAVSAGLCARVRPTTQSKHEFFAAAPRLITARQWRLLAGLCAVATMTTIDSTVVNVALPSIKSDFHAHLSSLQWVVTGYTLVFAMFMVPAGRVADLIGRDRIWVF